MAKPQDIENTKILTKRAEIPSAWHVIKKGETGLIDPSKVKPSKQWNDDLKWDNNPDNDWDAIRLA